MEYIIHEGGHRSYPPRLGLYYDKKSISKVVEFKQGCRYDLGNDNQGDINKLFGVGYFFNHHIDSARFGWRWNLREDAVEIFSYCYVSGERIYESLCFVPLFKRYQYFLNMYNNRYEFHVFNEKGSPIASNDVQFKHHKKWAYPLGVYFGGNEKAPNNVFIEMS